MQCSAAQDSVQHRTVYNLQHCTVAHFTKRQKWKLKMPWVVLCAESIYKQMLENVFCLKVSPSTVTGPPPYPLLNFLHLSSPRLFLSLLYPFKSLSLYLTLWLFAVVVLGGGLIVGVGGDVKTGQPNKFFLAGGFH